MDVFRLDPVAAGPILSSIAIGYIVGCPLTGMISDRLVSSRKKLALAVLSLYLLPWLLLGNILEPGREWFLHPAYAAIGLFASGAVLFITHLKELFPAQIVGTALSLSNLFAIGGAGILQYLMGWIIERHSRVGGAYPVEAYREAFLLPVAGMIVTLLLYLRTTERPPKK
jgi:sugar phosphate permease